MAATNCKVERKFEEYYSRLTEYWKLARPTHPPFVEGSSVKWISTVVGSEDRCATITALYYRGEDNRGGDIELRSSASNTFLVLFGKIASVYEVNPETGEGNFLRLALPRDFRSWSGFIEDLIAHPNGVVRRSI